MCLCASWRSVAMCVFVFIYAHLVFGVSIFLFVIEVAITLHDWFLVGYRNGERVVKYCLTTG